MRVFSCTVGPGDAGKRLDVFLAERTGLTRGRVQKLIAAGKARTGGETREKHYRVRHGEEVSLELPPPEPAEPKPQDLGLRVLYQDRHLAVVSKPAGMVVHPAAGHREGTLVNAALFSLDGLSGVGGTQRPGIVHRLDRDTSGLLVVAKDDRAHLRLQEMVRERTLKRFYLALVHGVPASPLGTVEAPVGRDPRDRKRMAVTSRGGRPSVTHFRLLEDFGAASLLEVELVTGRKHQIRVHMSYIGHPVVGDAVYGRKGKLERELGLSRQFLHAYRLQFPHPFTGEALEFEEPLPADLAGALDRLRGSVP
ncbi:RluA family pseudouridine synthase [Candidatus Solincola sp.]|nr:RluA family pseudouridine synthase [Actinomycetota bacterium]MDI7251488.1 RluA family pseudouridine synthase [Actinomycetota bacterium]